MAKCCWCGETAKLCKSHIIPESAYRPVYDAKSRAIALSSEDRKRRVVQQGMKEPLFCLECEGKFNRFETPFARFWGKPNRFPSSLEGLLAVRVDGIDYDNTRKVLLSILWRAHVAENPVLSAVKLGRHADRMLAIFSGPNSAADDYPMFCYALRDPATGGVARQLVLTPAKTKTDGQWNYLIAFYGCLWKIFVSSQRAPLPQSCALTRSGTILMPVMDYDQVPMIRNVIAR